MTRATVAARALLVTAVLAAVGAVVIGLALVPGDRDMALSDVAWLAAFLVFAVVGALIAERRPEHPMGWLLLSVGVLVPAATLVDAYSFLALVSPHAPLPGGVGARLVQSLLFTPAFAVATGFVPLLFPDGQLPSPGWRNVARLGALSLAVNVAVSAIQPGPIGEDLPVENPLGVPALREFTSALEEASSLGLLVLSLAGVVALVARWRRGDAAQRQVLRPFIASITALVSLGLVGAFIDTVGIEGTEAAGVFLLVVAIAAAPMSIALAVLHRGLYGIDVALNRTLVYGPLTAGVIGGYVAVVGTAGAVIGRGAEGGARLMATGLVALAFQPARQRVQRLVDRAVYGDRQDPYDVVTRVGHGLAADVPAEQMLPRLAHGVLDALAVRGVAIETTSARGVICTTAGSVTEPTARFAMVHRGEQVGDLVIAITADPLSAAMTRLYTDVARQCATAVHATALAGDLRSSQRRLVNAREDERRRVRRALHDGVGPTLAALGLQLESASDVIETAPDDARLLIAGVARELATTLADVRHLVYELRPPVLDALGLLPALRQGVAAFDRGDRAMPTTIEAPDDLPPLPAAVEAAAYRIVTEAVANAWRHAGARRCTVRVACNGGLHIEVRDDGRGLGEVWRPGVGVLSMRERAEELGGSCVVLSGDPAGTVVRIHLPMDAA